MFDLQTCKVRTAIAPAAIKDEAAFVSNVIDLNDFAGGDYLEFIGFLGATDVALATLRVMESDTKTDATTLGGSPELVVDATTKPSATDDGGAFVFGLALKQPRRRFVQLQATAGNGTAGTFLAAVAVGRDDVLSSSAAARGLLFAHYV